MSLTTQANQRFPKNSFTLLDIDAFVDESPKTPKLDDIENSIFDISHAKEILPMAKRFSFMSDYKEMRAKSFSPYEGIVLPANPQTILMIGNVGSGKSTFLSNLHKKLAQAGLPKTVIASTDDCLEQYETYKWACTTAYREAEQHGTYDMAHHQLLAATRTSRPIAQLMGNLLGQEALDNNLPCTFEITGKDEGGVELAKIIQERRPDMKTAIFVTTAEVSSAVCADRWHNMTPFCVSPEQARKDHDAVMTNLPAFVEALNGDVEIYARYTVTAKPVLVASRIDGKISIASEKAAAEYESRTGYELPSLQKSAMAAAPAHQPVLSL